MMEWIASTTYSKSIQTAFLRSPRNCEEQTDVFRWQERTGIGIIYSHVTGQLLDFLAVFSSGLAVC